MWIISAISAMRSVIQRAASSGVDTLCELFLCHRYVHGSRPSITEQRAFQANEVRLLFLRIIRILDPLIPTLCYNKCPAIWPELLEELAGGHCFNPGVDRIRTFAFGPGGRPPVDALNWQASIHWEGRNELLFIGLQRGAHYKIQVHELLPTVELGVTFAVLPVHTADGGAFVVDTATFVRCFIMPARAIAAVEKLGFRCHIDVLTTQATLGAGEGVHGEQYLVPGETPAPVRGRGGVYATGVSRLGFCPLATAATSWMRFLVDRTRLPSLSRIAVSIIALINCANFTEANTASLLSLEKLR